MSPKLKNEKPQRVIAQFGSANNPLFLVEQSETEDSFLIRDADQGLGESDRKLALVTIDKVDEKASQADVEIELNSETGEAAYTMSPGDLVAAIGAVAKAEHVKAVEVIDSNLPAYMIEHMTGPAELRTSDSRSAPFEFEIAA